MKSKLNAYLFFFCFSWPFGLILAQQLPMWSEYQHNNYVLNPAMMGWENITALSAAYRYQWTGMPEGPQTANLGFQHHDEARNMGYGGYFLHDRTGPTSMTGLHLAYAYQIRFSSEKEGYDRRQRLQLGLSLSAIQYRLRGASLRYQDQNDPLLINQTEQKILPDAGLGIMYYNDMYYLGLSVPQLISMRVRFESDDALSAIRRIPHIYTTMGAKIKLHQNKTDKPQFLVPSFWMQYAPTSPLHATINLRYWWNYRFNLGLGINTDGTLSSEFGLQLRQGLRFGYAFSLPLNSLAGQLGSSHELMFTYLFQSNGKGWQFEALPPPNSRSSVSK